MRAFGWSLVACALGASCSSTQPTHPDAGLLPRDVGVLVAESVDPGKAGFLEEIDPSTHTWVQHAGTAFDERPRLRRLTDPRDQTSRFFLLGENHGDLTEITRQGSIVAGHALVSGTEVVSGAGIDPADIAISADGSLFVTRRRRPSVLVLAPNGSFSRLIDLSAFAAPDSAGVPTMSAIAIVDHTAFVALARLSASGAADLPAQIVAFDVAGPSVAPHVVVDLPLAVPSAPFVVVDDGAGGTRLWVLCDGTPDLDPKGVAYGLVAVDVEGRAATAKVAITDDLRPSGRVPLALALDPDGGALLTGRAAIAGPDGIRLTSLFRFDLATGAVGATWFERASAELGDVAIAGERVLVADRLGVGLRVLDKVDGGYLGIVALESPPNGFLVLRP